ncbi:MAG: hypothetical protein O7C98_09375 [Planctomycetota bacterium]|nr:hypothetical protein [Planctomycetota bacterium]
MRDSIKGEFGSLTQEIPEGMPLVDEWLKRFEGQRPLEGVTALLIQHQLGNQVPQVRALLDLGLAPERLFWLDIPYTSNATTRAHVARVMGVPERNFIVSDYDVLEPYAPYQRARTQRILKHWLDDPPERLLVLDDGAYFLEAAACFRKRLSHVAIVEQTTRGFIKIDKHAHLQAYAATVPVVDVARSRPKLELEPAFIGHAVCAALLAKLGDRFHGAHGKRAVLLGYGAIGSRVAKFLETYLGFRRDRVHVFDPHTQSLEAATAAGFGIWDRADRGTRFSLVIGCSGRASFRVGDYVYLEDGAVLASASSGSVELSRQDFIDLADTSEDDDIWIEKDGLDRGRIHTDLRFRLVDREATLVNAGFPVNFDGRVNCVPTQYMQPTALMMVAASVQALSTPERGRVDLAPDFCEWVDGAFREFLGPDASVLDD